MVSRQIAAIIKKDFREFFKVPQIYMAVIMTPVVIAVAMPVLVICVPGFVNLPVSLLYFVKVFISKLPPAVVSKEFAGLTEYQQLLVASFKYFFVALFMLIPIANTSVIGADSLVREKDIKTIEAVLYSPVRTSDIWLGKLLYVFSIAMALNVASFLLYCLVVDVLCYPKLGFILLPNSLWIVVVFVISPLLTILAINVLIILSLKAKNSAAAQQLSGVIVIPILGLLVLQIAGVVYISKVLLLLLGLLIMIVDVLTFVIGNRLLKRDFERLLSST